MRRYRCNPDDKMMHMAVELAWSNTKDALKEYTSVYSIEDVIKLYDKQLFAVSGILPDGMLKKRKLRFQEILQSNEEFRELKVAIFEKMKKKNTLQKERKQLPLIPKREPRISMKKAFAGHISI